MNDCIFSAHCTELVCDRSCPAYIQTSYLLERNNISLSSPVFYKYSSKIPAILDMLDEDSPILQTYVVDSDMNTIDASDLITYCAICKYWRGSQLHCTVYNLRYSKYIDETKKSWTNSSNSEAVEYMKIWAESAKVLVVSNFDYIKFGDFESQTLLNLIQTRQSARLLTILVSPPIKNLITGSSAFANVLIHTISDASNKPLKFRKMGVID